MPSLLQNYIDKLETSAGWNPVTADGDGVYHYYLEDGIDLDILSPDSRVVIIRADLGPEPDHSTSDGVSKTQQIAKYVAASIKDRASVLCYSNSRIELYRRLTLNETSELSFIENVRDFLNDQAWWKEALAGNIQKATPYSSFSFGSDPSSWFPSQTQF